MIEIYGKSGCNYCSQLKQLLKIKKIQFSYTDIKEAGIDTNELSQICEGNIIRTLPQVLDEGTYVGGYRRQYSISLGDTLESLRSLLGAFGY